MVMVMPGSKSNHNWWRDPACKGEAAVNNPIPDGDGGEVTSGDRIRRLPHTEQGQRHEAPYWHGVIGQGGAPSSRYCLRGVTMSGVSREHTMTSPHPQPWLWAVSTWAGSLYPDPGVTWSPPLVECEGWVTQPTIRYNAFSLKGAFRDGNILILIWKF